MLGSEPDEKLVERARQLFVPSMSLPAVPGAQFRLALVSTEQTGLDVGIVRPVRLAGTAIDVRTAAILEPHDKTTGPGFAGFANPCILDSVQIVEGEPMPITVEATKDLHEVIEMDAVPLRASQGAA